MGSAARRLLRPALAVLALTAGLGPARAQAPDPAAGRNLVGALDAVFTGPHGPARAAHARGIVLLGRFTPDPSAAALSRAAHLAGPATPVIARFSNFPGTPDAPDGAAASSPRGMAIRFLLPDGVTTDLVTHSYDGFPAATPGAFLEFLQAVARPELMPALAESRPAVKAFLADPKTAPSSYATERFFGVNAFLFTNAAGLARFGRYRLDPAAGVSHLAGGAGLALPPDYLGAEMARRLATAPVRFQLVVQLARPGDDVTDGSVAWPAANPVVALGTVELERLVPDQAAAERDLQFRPTSLVAGIAASRDPMLVARTQAYRISSSRRENEE